MEEEQSMCEFCGMTFDHEDDVLVHQEDCEDAEDFRDGESRAMEWK